MDKIYVLKHYCEDGMGAEVELFSSKRGACDRVLEIAAAPNGLEELAENDPMFVWLVGAYFQSDQPILYIRRGLKTYVVEPMDVADDDCSDEIYAAVGALGLEKGLDSVLLLTPEERKSWKARLESEGY